MPLDNKCRIGPLAAAPPDTCGHQHETESGFITEDDTSPVCHTPSCPSDVVGAEVATLLIARSSRSFVFLDVLTLRDGTLLPSGDPLLSTPSNYHIAPTEVVADTSIRPTCFSEAYYTAPYQSPSAARTAAGYVLEAS
ncbi:hypothetical protein TNCV_1306471 [Trichonephila clavipes]|nr:hypothetical protein TNCV_1306471 [Trichonephila clavipes]